MFQQDQVAYHKVEESYKRMGSALRAWSAYKSGQGVTTLHSRLSRGLMEALDARSEYEHEHLTARPRQLVTRLIGNDSIGKKRLSREDKFDVVSTYLPDMSELLRTARIGYRNRETAARNSAIERLERIKSQASESNGEITEVMIEGEMNFGPFEAPVKLLSMHNDLLELLSQA